MREVTRVRPSETKPWRMRSYGSQSGQIVQSENRSKDATEEVQRLTDNQQALNSEGSNFEVFGEMTISEQVAHLNEQAQQTEKERRKTLQSKESSRGSKLT